jgi:DNA-binding transcriptional LysR family regulator
MQNGSERGVRMSEHVLRRSIRGLPDWEGAHMFLELVRRRSFRATADHLSISVNALRARIEDFETSLNAKLVTRHVDGVRMTAEGERVHRLVAEMEKTSFEMLRVCEPAQQSLTGEVRLSVTEGLGAAWVGNRLVEFQRTHRGLLVDVRASMQSSDVLRLETDIAVQLTRPTAKDLKVVKLGRLHLHFFAAPAYIERYGVPKSMADLSNHRLVIQTDDDEHAHRLYNQFFPGIAPEKFIAQRSNVSSVHYWAVMRGTGVGMLPTYVYALGAPLVPLDLPIRYHADIWMTYHDSASDIPRVRALADWMVEAFNPRVYPWFRDEYIAPQDLRKKYRGKEISNPFDIALDDDPIPARRRSKHGSPSTDDRSRQPKV